MSTQPAPDPSDVLPDLFATAFRRAMARMPYGADPRVSSRFNDSHRAPLTGEEAARALNALADVLAEHAERHNALVAEHDALRRDVAAVRRVFGTEAGA